MSEPLQNSFGFHSAENFTGSSPNRRAKLQKAPHEFLMTRQKRRRAKCWCSVRPWSPLTPNPTGISPMSPDIFYTVDLHTNYNVCLTWSRSAQLRFPYHPTKSWTIASSNRKPSTIPRYACHPGVHPCRKDTKHIPISRHNVLPAHVPDVHGCSWSASASMAPAPGQHLRKKVQNRARAGPQSRAEAFNLPELPESRDPRSHSPRAALSARSRPISGAPAASTAGTRVLSTRAEVYLLALGLPGLRTRTSSQSWMMRGSPVLDTAPDCPTVSL